MSKKVDFDNTYTARATGHFHGLESREAGTADAASRIAAQREFGATGDLNLLRGYSVPDGASLTGTLENSNAWNYGETRRDRGDIARLVNAANAGRKGGRNNKSKRRKYRKSNNPSRKKQPIKRIDSIKNVSKNKRKFIFKLFWSSITANVSRLVAFAKPANCVLSAKIEFLREKQA
jgi:hypothetical protein